MNRNAHDQHTVPQTSIDRSYRRVVTDGIAMMRTVVASAVFVTLAGCGASLTEAGRRVQLMKSDPPAGCVEIGLVSGTGSGAGAGIIESAKNDMRNDAAEMGATYVRYETADGSNVTGTAYKCPQPSAPASAP